MMAEQPPTFAGGVVQEPPDSDAVPLFLDQSCYLLAADGFPVTTLCPTPCGPDCELGNACHERHKAPLFRLHDPDDCERRRAALDEHSRLSMKLEA